MKMLTGFLEPSSGDISINGFDIADQTKQAQALIGYLPENLPVYPEMTVVDYLDYCARMRDLNGQSVEDAVKTAIDKTELNEKALQAISTLSRGYKQRVGVAQALLHNPTLLILDEPTNGLDPHQTHQMRDLIRALSGSATVIVSTHIMQEVDALCDRVIILDQGRLAVNSSLEELRQCDTLEVTTSANEEAFKAILADAAIPATPKKVEPKHLKTQNSHNTYQYHLPIDDVSALNTLCAQLSKAIINKDAELYTLNPLHRDLETVFRQIQSQRPEVNHAV